MDIITRPWRLYADFSGRSRRAEFWAFYVLWLVGIMILGGVPMLLVDMGHADEENLALFVPAILFVLASIVPSIAVFVRRLHDSNKSGWLFLLSAIPYIGWIFTLIFGLLPGSAGENNYGFDPRFGDTMADETADRIFG